VNKEQSPKRPSSRKYFFAQEVFLVSTLLVIGGIIGAGEWVAIAAITLGVFCGTNVVQKIFTKKE
jgi:hypothetical protein